VANAKKRASTRRKPNKRSRIPEQLELDLLHLLHSIERIAFTASTVMTALYSQDMGRDREMGVCVEENIADALDRLVADGAKTLRQYRADPYQPLLQSPLLGIRRGLRLKLSGAL
jgi:hypothetical protein